MIRLHVVAEGRTEQKFVQEILAPHLGHFGVFADARCVETSRDQGASRIYRGGLVNYAKAKRDINLWIKEDGKSECVFTTMFDFYALPDNFPDFQQAKSQSDPYARVKILESAFKRDIVSENGQIRFIPYIQLHEFEALIFANLDDLPYEYPNCETKIKELRQTVAGKNPELIDDGVETAPSKRLLAKIPEYNKVMSGVNIVQAIGLEKLKSRCAHFCQWLKILEELNGEAITR